MNTTEPTPSCADILNAFAVEPKHDSPTLQRYLKDYPQFAIEIASLSHELSRRTETLALSEKDNAAIDAAWKKHAMALSVTPVDVFDSFSVPQLRELANKLGVPRQIIAAFREHKVIVSTIPKLFLVRMAAAINTTVEEVTAALAFSKDPACVRSNKSEERPENVAPVSFEKLLIDANVPPQRRAELMADE